MCVCVCVCVCVLSTKLAKEHSFYNLDSVKEGDRLGLGNTSHTGPLQHFIYLWDTTTNYIKIFIKRKKYNVWKLDYMQKK